MTIADFPLGPSWVEASFVWSPQTTTVITIPGGPNLNMVGAHAHTALTFTATATIGSQGYDISGPLSIIEYYWDFGDGVIGYGNPVSHTYALVNLQATTKLRVTDSKNRQWWTRAQMYLA